MIPRQEIFLLSGVPGSGKSWVCERAKEFYNYIPHDAYIGGQYIPAIIDAAYNGHRPVLIETPFSMSQIITPLEDEGLRVVPIFVIESPDVLERRWEVRGTPESARKGHLTRQNTYKARAMEYCAFCGGSDDVLFYLKSIAAEKIANDRTTNARGV